MSAIPNSRQFSFTFQTEVVLRGQETPAIVSDVEVGKTLLGQWYVTYSCPSCGAELRSTEEELARPDNCPECFSRFRVSDDALAQIQDVKRSLEEDNEEKRVKKEEARREKQVKREEARQKRDAEREAKKQRRLEELEQQRYAASIQSDSVAPQHDEPDQYEEDRESEVEFQECSSPRAVYDGDSVDFCWYCSCPNYSLIQCPYCRMLRQ